MKKRVLFFLLTALLLTPLLANVGYSFFFYEDGGAKTDIGGAISNTLFDPSDDNDYYRVYFFASPYYATGAELNGTTTETDPLRIATSENNPYNRTDEYMLVGSPLTPSSNFKYGNLKFLKDGGSIYQYGSYKNFTGKTDESDVPLAGADQGAFFERYGIRDYTGYIRGEDGERIYTYVSLTVQGNISMEQLQSVVAATEYRDSFGFGPEFMGWTYKRAEAADHAMIGGMRYQMGGGQWVADSHGNGNGQSPYLYGNFGCQGEVEQVSSMTSLKAIDQSTADGSAARDKVIYLYPVFLAKNYNKPASVGGTNTAIIKFRINADNSIGLDNAPIYSYKQSGEEDRSIGRYTAGLFQTALNENKNNINYYIKNLPIRAGTRMQLDVCPVNNLQSTKDGTWCGAWTSLLSEETLSGLGLTDGFYDVDVTFVQYVSVATGGSIDTKSETEALVARYQSTNQYVKVCSSLDASVTGSVSLLKNYGDTQNKCSAYFVIGFRRVEEFRLVGDSLNGSLTDYDKDGYRKFYTTEQIGDQTFHIVESVYLPKDSKVSILYESMVGKSDLPYTLEAMSDDLLQKIQSTVGSAEEIHALGTNATDTLYLASGSTLQTNAAHRYTLFVSVTHKNGAPSSISVAYRIKDANHTFTVLAAPPTDPNRFYVDKAEFSDLVFGSAEGTIDEHITLTEGFAKGDAMPNEVTVGTIDALFDYADANHLLLIDTATGFTLTRSCFAGDGFCLNRDYVVYLKPMT